MTNVDFTKVENTDGIVSQQESKNVVDKKELEKFHGVDNSIINSTFGSDVEKDNEQQPMVEGQTTTQEHGPVTKDLAENIGVTEVSPIVDSTADPVKSQGISEVMFLSRSKSPCTKDVLFLFCRSHLMDQK